MFGKVLKFISLSTRRKSFTIWITKKRFLVSRKVFFFYRSIRHTQKWWESNKNLYCLLSSFFYLFIKLFIFNFDAIFMQLANLRMLYLFFSSLFSIVLLWFHCQNATLVYFGKKTRKMKRLISKREENRMVVVWDNDNSIAVMKLRNISRNSFW